MMHEMLLSTYQLLAQNLMGFVLLFGIFYSALLLYSYHRRSTVTANQLTHTLIIRSWNSRKIALQSAAFIVPMFLLPSALYLLHLDGSKLAALIGTLLFALLQLAVIIFIGRQRRCSWNHDFGMAWGNLKMLPLSLATYLAALPLIGMATRFYHYLLETHFHIEVDRQDIVQLIAESHGWFGGISVLLAVLVAPLYEELIFRGILLPYLTRKAGLIPGIMLVSLAFAIIHFHTPSFVPLFLLSVVLCLAYWRTGSLWVNIGIHTIFNGVTTGYLLLAAN